MQADKSDNKEADRDKWTAPLVAMSPKMRDDLVADRRISEKGGEVTGKRRRSYGKKKKAEKLRKKGGEVTSQKKKAEKLHVHTKRRSSST